MVNSEIEAMIIKYIEQILAENSQFIALRSSLDASGEEIKSQFISYTFVNINLIYRTILLPDIKEEREMLKKYFDQASKKTLRN